MKYKAGDVVKLRDDLEVNKFYGNTKLNEAMVNVIGKKAEIKEIVKNKNKDEYYAKFASRYGGNWFISDEMIEGLWEECKSSEQVSKLESKYKLIDILNKIANGELKEGTKVIRKDVEGFVDIEYTYMDGDLEREGWDETIYIFEDIFGRNLNDEVELIEPHHIRDDTKIIEPTNNTKIEELDWNEFAQCDNVCQNYRLFNKLNEVIRKLNKEIKMDNQPSNYDLAIGFLQVFDLLLNLNQVSNDDILKELQHQDNEYLNKIIDNQLKIIEQNDKILVNQDRILTRLGSD